MENSIINEVLEEEATEEKEYRYLECPKHINNVYKHSDVCAYVCDLFLECTAVSAIYREKYEPKEGDMENAKNQTI